MRTSFLLRLSLVGVFVACGDDGGSTPIDAAVIDAAVIDAALDAAVDAPSIDAPDNRTRTIDLAGGANGLLWDAASSTLYLTDNNANSLLKYTDANGIETVSTLPSTSAGASLGDMIKRNNGSIVTTNFGFGTQGTLFLIATNGTSSSVTGLDATRRRIGMAQDSGGQAYVAYFTGGGGNPQVGGVSSIAFTGGGAAATETEIAGASTTAGFKKLVGLVATTSGVFVTDQTDKKIYKIAIPGNAVTEVATVPSADMLGIMPDGDLLTGGGPSISRVTQAGAVSTIFENEFEQVRGIAYDNTAKRLFVINHSATVGTPDKLEIRPLDN